MPRGVNPVDEAMIQGQLWTPRQLPTLVGWFDADDPLTVYDATTGGNLVTTQGGTVKRWEDKSGRGNHATQSDNAAPKLQITSGTLNNKRVLAFTRVAASTATMTLRIPSSSSFDPDLLSVCCLMRSSQTNNDVGIAGRWYEATSWALVHRESGTALPTMYVRNSSNTANVSTQAPAGTTVTDGKPRLLGFESVSNGTLRLFVNGTQSSSTSEPSQVTGLNVQTNIGSYGGDQHGLTGDIAEILFWRTAGDEDRQKVEGYLAWKWGTRETLYPGHQYINRAPTLGD